MSEGIPNRKTNRGNSQTWAITKYTFVHHTVHHFEKRHWVDLS